MARRILILALAFVGMIVGIEGIRAAVGWWRGELAPGPFEWFALASLPFLVWLWWRYLSPFGKGRGQCLAASRRRDDTTN